MRMTKEEKLAIEQQEKFIEEVNSWVRNSSTKKIEEPVFNEETGKWEGNYIFACDTNYGEDARIKLVNFGVSIGADGKPYPDTSAPKIMNDDFFASVGTFDDIHTDDKTYFRTVGGKKYLIAKKETVSSKAVSPQLKEFTPDQESVLCVVDHDGNYLIQPDASIKYVNGALLNENGWLFDVEQEYLDEEQIHHSRFVYMDDKGNTYQIEKTPKNKDKVIKNAPKNFKIAKQIEKTKTEDEKLVKEEANALCILDENAGIVVGPNENFLNFEYFGDKDYGFFKITEKVAENETRTIFADAKGNIYRGKEAEVCMNFCATCSAVAEVKENKDVAKAMQEEAKENCILGLAQLKEKTNDDIALTK